MRLRRFLRRQDPMSGVWKLQSTRARYSEVWTVKQTTGDIRIRMDITDDQLGDRVLDVEARSMARSTSKR